jgi:8-oxo-dGTP pyrophosphatase MutT (NUDIX family)
MPEYACAILLQRGRILLGLRAPHRRAYANKWDVLGGKVEAGETVEAALARELGEELGVAPTAWTPLCTLHDDSPAGRGDGGRGDGRYHIFVVTGWTGGAPRMCNDEHSRLGWFSIDEACALADLALPAYREMFRTIQPG